VDRHENGQTDVWHYGKDRVPSKLGDIMLILQQNRLHWYGHVLQIEDND